INIHPFKRDLLDAWWTGFYGIKSNHAQWWERSSLRLWLRFFELIRKYKIPIPRNMVRMIRATLLYDTVAARLYSRINVFKEFEKYTQDVARRAKRQIVESTARQLMLGPDDANFLRFRQVLDIGDDILVRVRRYLDNQDFTFQQLAGKVYTAIRAIFRMFMLSAGAGLIAAVVAATLYVLNVLQPSYEILQARTWNPFGEQFILTKDDWEFTLPFSTGALQVIILIWFIVTAALLLMYGRRIYLRFGDVDD
ncbi:MAG TPA: hypothetical protein VGB76_01470, partial [Pyrinomonadaceae bacterium]